MQPSYTNSQTLPFKVAGHAGMRTTADGALVIKPAWPSERQFYELLVRDQGLASLRPFIPRFFGSLPPSTHTLDLDDGMSGPRRRNESIILENLCYGFIKPNTLDVKLGTVFSDPFTPPEKVLRNQRTARATTSYATGVRLTEFQVHSNTSGAPVCTPKSYGKALQVHELAAGLAQFFPAACDRDPESGRGESLGLPHRTLVPVLRGMRDTVVRIREAYAALEMRIVGGSLLLVYEADWARAEEGVKRMVSWPAGNDDHMDYCQVHRLPFCVKLVDFAHTRMAPGEGPDEGVLLGLDTMVKLLEGRIAQLS
ncbi:hypothetical protein H0H81_006097 [Sphagnurus paluster]|uniref:Kinase n=1 Tax=Sphagnurus paluster TaxID=117069 RepID=A0A9P7K6S8_9AGAR|nr:hypothetical protein H0H81_006097 [Sphagnurus paluster]